MNRLLLGFLYGLVAQILTFLQLQGNIKWNFGKILLGKDGQPIDRFGSMTSPSSKKLIKAIETALEG